MPPRPPLLTFRFLALCLFTLLAYCNISVFYSLYLHLETLGVAQAQRGPIIGASSLATILCFLLASPWLTVRNAPLWIFAGIAVLLGCGGGYLLAAGPAQLLALRLLNGAGVYLLSAPAMMLLVAHIAPERSGQAFGLYSVSALLPYSIIPALFDRLNPLLPSPAWGYAIMSLALLPAAAINLVLLRQDSRQGRPARQPQPEAASPASLAATLRFTWENLRRARTSLLLAINAVYYLNFAALFFLSKSLFESRGLGGVGLFFSIQTALMIVIRLCAARLFDVVDRLRLIVWCYALTAAGFALLWAAHGLALEVCAALVLGLGMGVGPPSLNGLMYAISEPRLRGVNSNLMTMALQAGSFLGPILGGLAVGAVGYAGFLGVGVAANLGGMALCWRFRRRGWHRAYEEGVAESEARL